MENILLPTEVLDNGIIVLKQKVKEAILEVAGVEEDEKAFKTSRHEFQIGFYLKNRKDALRVLAVATANDMDCGGLHKEPHGQYYEVFVNAYTTFR